MSAPRKRPWKVRVLREIEDWVSVLASTAEEAEAQARVLPGVKALRGVTLLAEKLPGERKVGVEDEQEEE